MTVCFITAGPIDWASSRYRAFWPAAHMSSAIVTTFERVEETSEVPTADAYIWQKIAHPGVMQALRDDGRPQYWDVCDPLWWFSPQEVKQITETIDGAVFSTEGLRRDFDAWAGCDPPLPLAVIPDRFDFDFYGLRDDHAHTSPVRLIWYGMAANRPSLYAAIANLHRLHANGYDISLTILDDRPNMPMSDIEGAFPVYYSRWRLDTEGAQIRGHDIALLPPYPGPWGMVKSPNKRHTAALYGLPVARGGYRQLLDLMDPDCRNEAVEAIDDDWDVRHSAAEWERILA